MVSHIPSTQSGYRTQSYPSYTHTHTHTGSGNLLSKDFNPAWYLLERHRFTSFQDLKLGLQRLELEVEKSNQAPVEFIRNNLDAFLQSYDTLSDILI